MKISPILKFEGIRIELDVAEARKIVERGDANRLVREIEVMLGVHDGAHDAAPDGLAVAALADSPARPALPSSSWKRSSWPAASAASAMPGSRGWAGRSANVQSDPNE